MGFHPLWLLKVAAQNPDGVARLATFVGVKIEGMTPWRAALAVLEVTEVEPAGDDGDEVPANGDTPAETQPKAMEQ